MPSLLSMGAGASEGLDTFLQRMMVEQQMQRLKEQQAETQRHNLAAESLTGRGQSLLEQGRADALNQKKTEDTVKTADTRGIGDVVSPAELAKETAAGIPSGRYATIPGMKVQQTTGFQSPPDVKSRLSGFTGTAQTAGSTTTTDASSSLNAPDTTRNLGTEAQRLARQKESDSRLGKDVSQEQKTVLVDGKPVDVLLNPKTGRYTAPSGEDVTDRMRHYEKPPSPDRVLIQTGSGYMTRADAEQQLKGGGAVPLATTSATRTMGEGASMLQPHIDSIKTQAEVLDKQGLFGPMMSRVRALAAQAGTIDEFDALVNSDPTLQNDRRVGRFATSLGLLASGAGRVHGGARGGGSPAMYENFKKMVSDAGTLNLFLGRMDAIDEYMTGYAAGPGGHAAPAGGGAPDAYQQYLNRTKPK